MWKWLWSPLPLLCVTVVTRSALVNIRRKALLSSLGFRKRMTLRPPRGSPCGSCKLRFDHPLRFVWWSDVCFLRGLVLLLRSSLDWLNQEDATASVWKGCFNASPRSSLLAHQEGPFSGCYWVTSLEWPQIQWHSWRNYTNKQIKLKWTAAPFNNFFKYWREYKKIENHQCTFTCNSLAYVACCTCICNVQ